MCRGLIGASFWVVHGWAYRGLVVGPIYTPSPSVWPCHRVILGPTETITVSPYRSWRCCLESGCVSRRMPGVPRILSHAQPCPCSVSTMLPNAYPYSTPSTCKKSSCYRLSPTSDDSIRSVSFLHYPAMLHTFPPSCIHSTTYHTPPITACIIAWHLLYPRPSFLADQ